MPTLSDKLMREYQPRVLELLKEVARTDAVIYYGTIQDRLGGPGRGFIGQVLSAICEEEHAQGRPLLTVIVVGKQSGDPGPGYWGLSMTKHIKPEERERAFKAESARVRSYWRNHA